MWWRSCWLSCAVVALPLLAGCGSAPQPAPATVTVTSPASNSSATSATAPATTEAPPPVSQEPPTVTTLNAPSTTPPSPTQSRAPSAATIDPTIYVGSPRGNVENALKRLGYTKFTYDVVDSDKPAGTVLAVNPTGLVPFDQPVTIRVSAGTPGGGTHTASARR